MSQEETLPTSVRLSDWFRSCEMLYRAAFGILYKANDWNGKYYVVTDERLSGGPVRAMAFVSERERQKWLDMALRGAANKIRLMRGDDTEFQA